MGLRYLLLIFMSYNLVISCVLGAAHLHSLDTQERELDGSYRPRDGDHYGSDGEHNYEFDHEAILGSVKEAEEFDKLSPEESRERLALLLPKMDLNGDGEVDREELKRWILNSFSRLSVEEAQERMSEVDDNHDAVVTWQEYVRDAFGVDSEEDIGPDEQADSGMLLQEEKEMWAAADQDGDQKLDFQEFSVFTNPEEHSVMHVFLVKQTLREKDTNRDGKIDFKEFVGDRGVQQDQAWLVAEKERFDQEFDLDQDGILDKDEVKAWVVPDNNEIAQEEVDHLFAHADDDHSDTLSFAEILEHHTVFVGSEATDYGNDMMGQHFDDEL